MENRKPTHSRQLPRRALLKGAAVTAAGLAAAGGIVAKGYMQATSQNVPATPPVTPPGHSSVVGRYVAQAEAAGATVTVPMRREVQQGRHKAGMG